MILFTQTLTYKLCLIAEQYAHYQALYVDGQYYTYQQLFIYAQSIAEQLLCYESEHVCLLMQRNFSAYASILACWLSGKVYVPLNNKEPLARLKEMYRLSGARLVVTDEAHYVVAQKFIDRHSDIIQVVATAKEKIEFVLPIRVTQYAYLMFTSGSTGMPKAVMIDHNQLIAFVENIYSRARMCATDRFSQITELSFDFSIYEIFACWFVGATLYIFPDKNFISLAAFIITHQITFFACVPSTVLLLQQCKKLNAHIFPALRYTVFCGEALTNNIAKCWHEAAPNTVIDNLYGPTEATVAICAYRWTPDCCHDVVPIGTLFAQQKFKLHYLDSKVLGELLLTGSQVIQSYWQSSQVERFIHENNTVWYKTGDLVFVDEVAGLVFVGRLDDQLKICGYRVEKLAIECLLKKAAQTEAVAVVAMKQSDITMLTAYIAHSPLPVNEIFQKYRTWAPEYMVPHKIELLPALPYNKNGKVDYKQLVQYKKIFPGFVDLLYADEKRNRIINVALWYPSHALPKTYSYRKYYQTSVAFQARIVAGRYPLLLFSHGQSGHRFNQYYLAEFMAEQGYIVAAIEHANDDLLQTTELLLYDRVEDIDFCLQQLLQDPLWQDFIEPGQIGIVGHSLGATTAILLCGGTAAQNNQFFQEKTESRSLIRAMMLMAPAYACFFSRDSLQSLNLPILMIASGKDELLPDDAKMYVNGFQALEFIEFAEAGHFIYLMTCPQAVEQQCPTVCIDIGMPRQILHPILQQHALRFFSSCLR